MTPMPGIVLEIRVSQGDVVSAGDTLIILEAMKMEQSIVAPADGLVERITVELGELVEEGAELVVFEVLETSTVQP